jgi:hypothetical protein
MRITDLTSGTITIVRPDLRVVWEIPADAGVRRDPVRPSRG